MPIKSVLLVDDEPDIRRIGQLSLGSVGKWQVTLAASGAEALRLAEQAPPDLILLDVMMPDQDGPAVLQQLRARPALAAIPVIFMTAKVQRTEVERYHSLGATGVISKPFDPLTLPAQIRQLLGEKS